MRKLNILTATITILLALLLSHNASSVRSQDDSVVVHDRYDIPMVFVPSGIAQIGATLDEAAEKCEDLRDENNTARTGDCRRELADSVPDGIDFLVTPVDEIYLEDYFIDQYEVTIQSYQVCVDDEICNGNVLQYLRGFSPYESLDEPMRYISYIDAEAYCKWRGGYVPTEAEWAYAARGPEGLAFPWGNEFDGRSVNFCDKNCQVPVKTHELWDDGFVSIAPVTAHPQDRSWVGAIGMAGNVSEWTSTEYTTPHINYEGKIARIVKGGFFGQLLTRRSYGDDFH